MRGHVGRGEGRELFGRVRDGYDRARPEYPDRVYELLTERCGLSPDCRTVEIGAGSGLATRRLLESGRGSVLALEPDRGFSSALLELARASGERLTVRETTLEAAELPPGGFDLAVCATSFHWLDPAVAPRKLGACLRPGGWLAVFWNVFGDPRVEDPFHEATAELLARLPTPPSHVSTSGVPFALDREARYSDFVAAHCELEFQLEELCWTLSLDPEQVRALYATFSPIARLPTREKESLLGGIAGIARTRFGGRVERHVVTPVYTGRRSG